MKNDKIIVFTLIILLMNIIGGCRRPFGLTINNNKEMAKLIPILKEDAPLIIERLEILRLGLSKEKHYHIRNLKEPYAGIDGYQIEFWDGYYRKHGDFMESLDFFSEQELNAIDYLLYSDEIKLNVELINFLGIGIESSGATFAIDGRYNIGVYYFDTDKLPKELQQAGDYAEELQNNYWIVFWFFEFS